MKRFIKQLVASISMALLVAVPTLALAPSVGAQSIQDNVCKGVLSTTTDGGTDCSEAEDGQSFAGLAKKIINIFSIVVGAVSVIMIIIGGFRYIISGGDSNGVTGAKNTILYAIVGLVIVIFAQVIVRFVLTNVK